MRVVAVALLLLSGAVFVHGHEGHQCIHDAMVHTARSHWKSKGVQDPFELRADVLTPHSQELLHGSRRLQSYSGIRIQIMLDKLADGADLPYVCEGPSGNPGTFVEGSGQSTSFSNTFPCTANDVMHVGDAKYNFLVNHILQDALSYFSNALSVIPVTATLSWTSPQTWNNFTCFNSGRIIPYICCDAILPPSGRTGVGGVSNADYVLYITKRPTLGTTLAWALPCFSDTRPSSANRPIMGQANFSPAQISLAPSAYAQQLSTAIHEISHALGFTSSKFSQFINPVTGTSLAYSSIIYSGYDASLQKSVIKMITPNVVAKIKEHFGCTNWPNAGAELEDYGGSGTAGSHWEKRVYFNEYMTGTADPNSVYSAITLALFQDSGWYQVNYSMAQTLPWGNNKGCPFAQQQCSVATWGSQYFCSASQQEGCTADMRYRAICNLYTFGSALPASYQYFTNGNMGGQMPYADYCPYYQRYSNGDCWDTSTTGYFGYGEVASPGSPTARCFAGTFLLDVFGVVPPRHSACLQFTCNAQSLIVIKLNGQGSNVLNVVCPAEGGDVNLATLSGSQFVGVITCPKQSELCTGNPCDNQFCSGHGVCSPSTGTCSCNTRWYGNDAFSCNLQLCPSNSTNTICSGHGTCAASTGTCTCASGYMGTQCDTKGCTIVNGLQCNGQGNCTNGVCQCFAGYIGNACSIQDCAGTPRCNEPSQGTCDTTMGVCSCTDSIIPSNDTASSFFTGVDCGTSNSGLRTFTELRYVNETFNGTVGQPVTVTLQPKEYQYFTFTAASAAYRISAKLVPQSAASVSAITFVAAYSDVYALPSNQQSQFTAIVTNNSANYETITFNPPAVVNGVIQQSTFNRAGVIHIAAVSTAAIPVTVQITLARDSCAVLNCTHGATCSNGACQCPRATTYDGLPYGWAGDDCSSADCPGTPHCSGRGTCQVGNDSMPYCECSRYYNGSACQTAVAGNTFVYPGDSKTLEPMTNAQQQYSIDNSMQYSTKSGVALVGRIVRTNLNISGTHVAAFQFDSAMSALFRLVVDGTPDADVVLMGRANQPPTLSAYDSFDIASWTSGAESHGYATVVSPGEYYLSVMNSRYAQTPLNFTLYYEFATLCPPSLTNSSNVSTTLRDPGAPSQPCSGHGDPLAYCSNSDPAALPPSNPVLCVCQIGWEGVYCEIPAPQLQPAQPQAVTGLAPGSWRFFVFVANVSHVELNVQAVRTSASLRSQPLVMVGRVPVRTAASLGSIFDSSALFDFNGYSGFSGSQNVKISRSNSLSARPSSEFFFIGVHNTKTAKANVDLSLTVQAHAAFTARCPASLGSSGQADCLSAAATTVCGGRGAAMTTQEDTDAVDCQCDAGWNRRTWCQSPQVFQSFGQFLTATQNITFLCNVCHEDFDVAQHAVSFYRIPQPLQKATGLAITTAQEISAANPSLMVAQNLPRSIADFVFVSSSTNLSQTISIDSASPTGSYWVTVYANNAGQFNLSSKRNTHPVNVTANAMFLAELGNWLVNSTVGVGALVVCCAVFFCVCMGCCLQYLECSRSKPAAGDAKASPTSPVAPNRLSQMSGLGMFDPSAPELRRNSSRFSVELDHRRSSRNVFSLQQANMGSSGRHYEMAQMNPRDSAIFSNQLQPQKSFTRTSLRGISTGMPPSAAPSTPMSNGGYPTGAYPTSTAMAAVSPAAYYAQPGPYGDEEFPVYAMPDGSFVPPPPPPQAPPASDPYAARAGVNIQSKLKNTKFGGTAASLFAPANPVIPPPPAI